MSNRNSPPTVELISIGEELLSGDIVDTNQPWMAKQLRELGFACRHLQTVGDGLDAIAEAFKLALRRSRIVVATGGLGPTEDDMTVEAVARCLGVELEYHEEVMDQMAERLKRPKDTFAGANRKQAQIPAGAKILQNHWGTAPGIHCSKGLKEGQHLFLMPGVPGEMKGLFEKWIGPFLKEHVSDRAVYATRHLHTFGLSESRIGDLFKTMMEPGRNPLVGTRVNGGVVSVRLTASGATHEEAQALLEPDFDRSVELLGDHLFGTDNVTLAEATLLALLGKKLTVAVAESCTAGLVASHFCSVPGASNALMEGAVIYSNASKVHTLGVKPNTINQFGAVSVETAEELANGIRKHANVDIGLSVSGIAGPGGGSEDKPVGLIYLSISTPEKTWTEKRIFSGYERNVVRDRAAKVGLDLIRRTALAWKV